MKLCGKAELCIAQEVIRRRCYLWPEGMCPGCEHNARWLRSGTLPSSIRAWHAVILAVRTYRRDGCVDLDALYVDV